MAKIQEVDLNIVKALSNLKTPMKTSKGVDVFFQTASKRNESIFEHIANKKHHMHVVDIDMIPIALKDKTALDKDKKGTKFHNYYFKRKKLKEKKTYIKIITKVISNKREEIINVYLVKKKYCCKEVYSPLEYKYQRWKISGRPRRIHQSEWCYTRCRWKLTHTLGRLVVSLMKLSYLVNEMHLQLEVFSLYKEIILFDITTLFYKINP